MNVVPYYFPTCCFVKSDDPDLPAFYFDAVINPISAYKSEKHKRKDEEIQLTNEDFDQYQIPETVEPY